jgi:hypothetical protein
MDPNPSSSFPRKRRFYLGILLTGILTGAAVTLLSWLQKWTPLRAPHGLYAALFWVGVGIVLILGVVFLHRHASRSKVFLGLTVLAAIGLAWLFPQALAPDCGGMPRALAHWENQCTTTCTPVCTLWVPLTDPTCAAEPHQPWDIGCCWTYGQSCTTSCTNVWVDDPPTVSGTMTCSTPGTSGWCRGGAALSLTASDPQNYPLTISGSIGGTPFSCSGSSCTQALPDGSGSASFTAVAAGGSDLSSSLGNVSYQADSTAPSLTLSIPAPNGDHGWFTSGPVTATASATDATSGVASVSINGGGSSFTASSDGVYPLSASATDNAGNTATASGTIQIDSTPPSLTVSVPTPDGQNGWFVSPVVVSADASDATSGVAKVQVQVDGGAWQDGSSVTIGTDGSTTVQFQAWDQAGNSTSSSPLTVQVDRTPPVATVSLPAPDGQNGWYVSPVTVTASSSDVTSGLASQGVSLDGTTWAPSVTISTDGVTTVQVQAQDNAGNTASASRTVRVDTTPPSASLMLPQPDGQNGWYLSPVTASASGSDATSGVATALVSLDGSSWAPSLTLSTDGVTTIQGRVTDNAGNATTVSGTVSIDRTPPVLSSLALTGTPGQAGWYTSDVGVSATATDATSGLTSLLYSLDGGPGQAGPVTVPDGRHSIQVQATDLAGNTAAETQAVDVDTVPPLCTLNSPAEGSLTTAHGKDFDLSGICSDATSGVAGVQISLDGGASWQPLSLDPDGSWSYSWDTTTAPDGPHVVLVRAADRAGNQEADPARITVIVANLGPSASIPSSFLVGQQVPAQFSPGILPITGARIVVSDGTGHTRTYTYSPASLPTRFLWDGLWDDGTQALPGSYPVQASAWDLIGNRAQAVGTVQVPPPSPTPTPTSTPAATRTPTVPPAAPRPAKPVRHTLPPASFSLPFPTRTPTASPSPTSTPTVTPTAMFRMPSTTTPVRPNAAPVPSVPVHQVASHPQPLVAQPVMLWPVLGFLALLAALASASLSDPRPQALRCLAQTLDSIQDHQS